MTITLQRATPDLIEQAVAIDDDACTLYETVGLRFDIAPDHPFALSEHARWLAAMQRGDGWFAETSAGRVGLLVLAVAGGVRNLEQLSVRRDSMRQGIGRRLLAHAIEWAGAEPLWLTTYAHLPWNRPFYERHGFTVVPERDCPRAVAADLAQQRRWLPAPEQRIAMSRR
jgi:GNAT superfamily N-acetyltransferase